MKRLFVILAALTAGMSFAYTAAAQGSMPTGDEIKAAMAKCDSAWTGGQNPQLSTQCKTACLRETAARLSEQAGETEGARQLYEQARVSRQILEAFGPNAARHCSGPGGAGGTAAARPGQPGSGADAGAARDEALTREQRIQAQRGLAALGYDAGPADGAFGRRTRAAIREWQRAIGREATGYLTRDEAEALADAGEASREEQAAALSPKCTGMQKGASCWIELANKPGCYLFSYYYNPLATSTWSGACSGGVAVGRGTWGWETSDGPGEATGTLVRGKRNGRWVLRSASGTVQEGPFVDGKKNGRWVERFANGDVQEGPFVDGKEHGRWVLRFANGNVQEGPFVDGKEHGRWVLRFANGNVWEGPLVDGKKNGRWTVRWADGRCLVLNFSRGKESGPRSRCGPRDAGPAARSPADGQGYSPQRRRGSEAERRGFDPGARRSPANSHHRARTR